MNRQFLYTIRLPLLIALVNSLVWSAAGPYLPEMLAAIIFNVVRLILILWAGALVLEKEESRLWSSAAAGAMVLAIDHLIVTGAIFLLRGEVMASLGVLVSFIMFVWVAMLLGALAGFIRRKATSNESRCST